MIYALLIAFFMQLTAFGFAERFILGSAMLAEIRRECGKNKRGHSDEVYAVLRNKLLAEPLPFYISVADKLFSQSKEAQTATLWRETGAALNEFLYTLMPFGPLGAAAVWHDKDVQARLKQLYAQPEVTAFNVAMELFEERRKTLEAKLKQSHSWWYPVQNYRVFKDAHMELEVLLRHTLEELLYLGFLIQYIAPEFIASPFKYLVPAIDTVIAQLEKKYKIVEQIDTPPVERLYNRWRTNALKTAISRCVPPIIPMGRQVRH